MYLVYKLEHFSIVYGSRNDDTFIIEHSPQTYDLMMPCLNVRAGSPSWLSFQ